MPRLESKNRRVVIVVVLCVLGLAAAFGGALAYLRWEAKVRTVAQARLMALIVRRNLQDNAVLHDFQGLEELLSAMVKEGFCDSYYYYNKEGVCYCSNVQDVDMEDMKDPITIRGRASEEGIHTESFVDGQKRSKLAVIFPVRIAGRDYGTLRFDFPLTRGWWRWTAALFAGLFVFLFVAWFAFSVQVRWSLDQLSPIIDHVESLERGDYRHTLSDAGMTRTQRRLLVALRRLTDSLRDKERIHRYITKSTLYRIHQESGSDPDLAGEKKTATVLFSDLEGFTELSETLTPKETVKLLNTYLDLIVGVILKNGGVVERFIGDSILAVFYSREPADGAHKAVIAALEIYNELLRFNKKRVADKREIVTVRVGIDTGEVIVGNIGSAEHLDYTIIGGTVKTAARIEKVASRGKTTCIYASFRTYALVEDFVKAVPVADGDLTQSTVTAAVHEVIAVKDVERLLGDLAGADPETAIKLIDVLGNSREGSVVPGLRSSLRHDDPGVRAACVHAMAKLDDVEGSGDTADHLAKVLRGDPAARVRATIVSELAHIGDTRHLEVVRACLDDKDPRVRANAVQCLCRLHEGCDVRDWIEPLLQDTNNRVKANVAIVLWTLGDGTVLNVLRQMLFDSEEDVRASAIYAIGEVGALEEVERHLSEDARADRVQVPRLVRSLSSTVDNIIESLEDESPMVRYQAITALGKLGDRKAVEHLLASLPKSDSVMLERMGEALERMGVSGAIVRLVRSYRPPSSSAEKSVS